MTLPNSISVLIQDFNKITILSILLLKTTRLSNLVLKVFKADDNEVVKIGNKINKTVINLFKNNKSRNLTYIPNIGATKKSIFLTPNIKKIFNHLRQLFIGVLIF